MRDWTAGINAMKNKVHVHGVEKMECVVQEKLDGQIRAMDVMVRLEAKIDTNVLGTVSLMK